MSSNVRVEAAALWLMHNAVRATNAIFLIATFVLFRRIGSGGATLGGGHDTRGVYVPAISGPNSAVAFAVISSRGAEIVARRQTLPVVVDEES
jgi:hypothetical protein